jgi:hypothetical protein
VFSTPTILAPAFPGPLSHPKFYEYTGVRPTKDGVIPYLRFVIRKKGQVEAGIFSCAMCHVNAREDGTVIRRGQGNFLAERLNGLLSRQIPLEEARRIFKSLCWIPWVPDRQRQFESYSVEEIVSIYESYPAGVLGRNHSSPFFPAGGSGPPWPTRSALLDKTGVSQHRGIADLMCYAALAEGIELLSSFDGFIPNGEDNFKRLPPAESQNRFSENSSTRW